MTRGSFVLALLVPMLLFAQRGWCVPESILPAISPGQVLGENRSYVVQPGDSMVGLALQEGYAFQPLMAANPGIDPWLPPAGRQILLPEQTIMPAEPSPGILINIPEFRLYYTWLRGKERRVRRYPIGVGVEGWETPVGNFSILRKVAKPSWTAPASIRRERPNEPFFVPPGPDNPLGDFWMQVSTAGHGIHGTNKPMGVGRRVSHGCIRLYPDDIRDLFKRVPVGTPVRILYQPLKLGIDKGRLVMEVHFDFLARVENPLAEVVRQKKALQWPGEIELSRVLTALREARGIPVQISP